MWLWPLQEMASRRANKPLPETVSFAAESLHREDLYYLTGKKVNKKDRHKACLFTLKTLNPQ